MDELLKSVASSAGTSMPSGLGDAFEGMDVKEVAKKADAFLKMLDEMAESDPEQYASFIAQKKAEAQAEAEAAGSRGGAGAQEAAAMQKLVQGTAPAMVVEAQATGPGLPSPGVVVAVTIWAASAAANVPAVTVSSGTPVSAATTSYEGLQVPLRQCREPLVHPEQKLQRPEVGGGPTGPSRPSRSYFVAGNQETIRLAMQETGQPAGGASLRMLVAAAACQFVEAKHRISIQRDGWRVLVDPSQLPEAERVSLQARLKAAAVSRAVAGTGAEGLPSSLLDQLSSLAATGPAAAGVAGGAGGGRAAAGQAPRGATPRPKGPLIVEMD